EPLPGIRERAGEGVAAVVDGIDVRLGALGFCGVEPAAVAAMRAAHPTASLIAYREGRAAPVLFALGQSLKADAVATVARLKREGYRIEILSGDREAAVAEAARALDVADWRAERDPAAKIARLDALKAEGRRVLMVGDGLNDAPSLAAAHVSLSPVTAAHVAQSASDAVFLGDRLAPVAIALDVARAARRLMMENLWIAVVYNAVAVPIAILGYVTPLIAALAMSGSSLIVTVNALRLRRVAPPPTARPASAAIVGETGAVSAPVSA
ncbi:HAD-IC family P-type ATPase, partial [Oharaeibacter diazotrophicus]